MSEDMKPIASEVENNVEQPVVTNPEAVAAPVEEIIDYSKRRATSTAIVRKSRC